MNSIMIGIIFGLISFSVTSFSGGDRNEKVRDYAVKEGIDGNFHLYKTYRGKAYGGPVKQPPKNTKILPVEEGWFVHEDGTKIYRPISGFSRGYKGKTYGNIYQSPDDLLKAEKKLKEIRDRERIAKQRLRELINTPVNIKRK
ncbi:MAG: hypothetical protein AB8E15_01750 [Bdellovibrionales bacterium]